MPSAHQKGAFELVDRDPASDAVAILDFPSGETLPGKLPYVRVDPGLFVLYCRGGTSQPILGVVGSRVVQGHDGQGGSDLSGLASGDGEGYR